MFILRTIIFLNTVVNFISYHFRANVLQNTAFYQLKNKQGVLCNKSVLIPFDRS